MPRTPRAPRTPKPNNGESQQTPAAGDPPKKCSARTVSVKSKTGHSHRRCGQLFGPTPRTISESDIVAPHRFSDLFTDPNLDISEAE